MREPRSKLRFLVRQLVHNPIVQRPSTAVLISTPPHLHLKIIQLLVHRRQKIKELLCKARRQLPTIRTAIRSRFTQQADQQTAKTGNMAQNAQP
jgi:hypothetical protein